MVGDWFLSDQSLSQGLLCSLSEQHFSKRRNVLSTSLNSYQSYISVAWLCQRVQVRSNHKSPPIPHYSGNWIFFQHSLSVRTPQNQTQLRASTHGTPFCHTLIPKALPFRQEHQTIEAGMNLTPPPNEITDPSWFHPSPSLLRFCSSLFAFFGWFLDGCPANKFQSLVSFRLPLVQ